MYDHQDWNVVILRKFKKNNVDVSCKNEMVEKTIRNKPKDTVVDIRKLEDNHDGSHHVLVSKEVANEIVKKRIELKMTQADLAQKINEKPCVIQEVESMKAIYNHVLINKIYRALDIKKKR